MLVVARLILQRAFENKPVSWEPVPDRNRLEASPEKKKAAAEIMKLCLMSPVWILHGVLARGCASTPGHRDNTVITHSDQREREINSRREIRPDNVGKKKRMETGEGGRKETVRMAGGRLARATFGQR